MNLSMKQKQTHRLTDSENRLEERVGGGIKWEFEVSRCKLLCIKWINSKVLLNSAGNYVQYPGINHTEKNRKKNVYIYIYTHTHTHTHVHIAESLCCTAEIKTTL